MKRFFLIAIIGLISFNSCQDKSSEILETKEEKVTLKELKGLNHEAKRVFVKGLNSREENISLFTEKLNIILDEGQFLNGDSEIKFINELIQILNSDLTKNYLANKEEFNKSMKDWQLRSRESVKWDDETYRFLLYTLETDLSKYQYDVKVANLISSGCECSTSGEGVFIDDCAGPSDTKCLSGGNCEVEETGCGTAWLNSCNGYCEL